MKKKREKMRLHNIKIDEGGTHDFDISMTSDEVQFLVNLALDYLIDKEYIELNKTQSEYDIDLLNSLDKEDMFKA